MNSGKRTDWALRCLPPVALWIVVAVSLGGLAQARHHHKSPSGPPPAAASAPVPGPAAAADPGRPPVDAATAPAAATPAVSLKKLEEAYRQAPNPEALFQLGLQAGAQGKTVEAQDFLRRYLADPLTESAAAGRAEAERVMALPRPPSGEVQILADQYGFVFVDGRLVGTLPLPLPLLVPVGPHVILVEMRDRTMHGKVKVPDGRGLEMRFSRATGAVVVTLPPAVILLTQYVGMPPAAETQRRLQQAVEQAIQKDRLAVFSKEVALARSPKLRDCLPTLGCQAQLATENEVDYALVMRIERPSAAPAPPSGPGSVAATAAESAPPAAPEAWSLQLGLVDAETADTAATATLSCPSCTGEQAAALLPAAVLKLLREGQGRPRGALAITSDPPGAGIKLGTRLLGTTPYTHPTFAGSYEVVLEKSEYQPARLQVEVKEGKQASLAVTLVAAEPPPAPLLPPPVVMVRSRPRWRLISGGLLLGAGVILIGFGSSALAVNGKCLADPIAPAVTCMDRFDTSAVGGGLLGAGVALTAGGAVLLALPGVLRPAASDRRISSAPGGLGLVLAY